MVKSGWRRLAVALAGVLVTAACAHPIEIVGEGDVVSASGTRDCSHADHTAGSPNCTQNLITGDYSETYTGVPAPGWHFHRWGNYCSGATDNTCTFDLPAALVDQFAGEAAAPLVAIFRPDVITGYDSLFIGHSFFAPFANAMAFHGPNAGFPDHTQDVVFAGGANGAPEALWNNATKRAEIQAVLDNGDVDLFGMTYHPDYPSLTGYRNWVDYALERNPDTRFFVAMPWLPYPETMDAGTYEAVWHAAHETLGHGIVDSLRDEYPGVDFYGIPYGQAAVELYNLYADGLLPDVDTLVSGSRDAIFRDNLGHADDILAALGELVWLRAIYGVPLSEYSFDPGYSTDLKAIADAIMDGHDPDYDAP